MPPLSALKELGKVDAPSLKTSFSTYLLDWGKISHLIPQRSTQNQVYLYDQEKLPALVQEEILLSNLSSRELPSDAITFPPRDIYINRSSETSSDSLNRPKCGDICLWKTESGNVLGCWVVQAKRLPVKTWIRVNVRRANLRHPLDSAFQLEVDTNGVIGWVPVQIFAANSLVKDSPPPPDFENLGKIYLNMFGLVHLFLIRHEDSDEQNLCYVHCGAPSTFQIILKDPSVMTKPGDIFIDIPGYIDKCTITPTSLIREQLWVRSKGNVWSEIKRVNDEYKSRHVRHPIHPDYVLEPPTLRSAYPQWVFEPMDAVSDTSLPPHDIHTKDAPTTDPIPRAKDAVPPANDPVCGQKRSAPETPETIGSEQSNEYASRTVLFTSRRMKEIDSRKVDGAKKRKLSDVVQSVPTAAGSSKGSEGRQRTKDPLPILPPRRSIAITDVALPQPPTPGGSFKLSKSANDLIIAPEAHDDLKRRLDKTRKKYILQKNMVEGLRNSLLEAQDSLQKHRTEAQQADVDRQAEISTLAGKLRGRSQEVQRLSDEVQATKAHVSSTEKALKGQKNACSLVTSQLEQLQKSSHDDQRQLALLRELRSDAEAKLDAANGELSEIRDAVDRLRKENGVEHTALADAVNRHAVAESRVQKMEVAMKDLLQKKEEHEKIAQHNANLEIELQRTKDKMERSVDTAEKATRQVTALEEIRAKYKQYASVVGEEISGAREEISQLRCDVKRKASLEIELQRTKDEMERSADTATKATSQITALEEIIAKHKRNAIVVDDELSRAREEISQLRCDVKRNASLEIELQRTKDELERSADTAEKAASQVVALEESCAKRKRNYSAVEGELSRAREEISELRCDMKRNASLEIELQRTKDELERSADTATKAASQVAALEEVCAIHKQNYSAVDEELTRAREENSQLIKDDFSLKIDLERMKDELEHSVDTVTKATSQVTALEEICADHERNASAVDEKLSCAREEIRQLRCDVKHNANLAIELQQTKDELERSAETAKKAKSQVAALEEVCENHSAVDEELSRAREEISQLRCDVKHKASLEVELQRTIDDLERSVDTAKKATSQVATLEEICAKHKRDASVVDEELTRAREEISQLMKHNDGLKIELQRTKDETERSVDTAKKATSRRVAALEEACANHKRNYTAVDEELSRARGEISQLRCDIKRNANLESELQRTKEEMERSVDTAKKAKSQVAALEEICANHKSVDEELARAREEISQLCCDVKDNASLEIELQRTKDEMERSAKQATSQVAALEEICANHERNASAVDEELSRAREETSQLRCDIKTREEVVARETRAREDSDAVLSSTKRFLEQERSGFTTALSGIQDELCAEQMRRRSSEDALEAIRRECRSPFKVPVLMDLFLEMDRRAKGESL